MLIKNNLVSNFFSLTILQIFNYILPFITFPYLVKTLGVEKFGLLSFVIAITNYFNIIVDYGFNLIATREISIYRKDKLKLSEIFSSVMIMKVLLLLLSLLILTIIVFSFNKLKNNYLVYYFSFGIVIGQALFPQWFFQGIEEMKYITFLNVFAKLIFTIFIFIFIHKSNDYIYVPLINSLGYVLVGVIGLILVLKKYKVRFFFVEVNKVLFYVREGWFIFLSKIFVSGLTNNVFFIGMFFNNQIVGYYAIAEKIVSIIKSFVSVVSQTLFPYMSKLMSEDFEKGLVIVKKIIVKGSIILLILIFIIFLLSPYIFGFLIKNDFETTLSIFRILLIIPIISFISMIIGQQILLPLKQVKIFSYSLIVGGVFYFFLIYPVIEFFGIFGVVWLLVFIETFVMLYRFIGLYFILYKKEN